MNDDDLVPHAGSVYEAVSARRVAYDQLMWQVPALNLTAQAFLVNVGVGASAPLGVRALALLLGALSGGLSLQLMAKQRFHEQIDAAYLRAWEREADLRPVAGLAPHDHAYREKAVALGIKRSFWVGLSSYALWIWGLRGFSVASLGLLVWLLMAGTP